MTLRVILIDDHAVMREALGSFLEKEGDIAIAGQAADGCTGLRLVEKLKPDVVLLDVAMRGMNGFDTAARIRQRHPRVKILALSAHADKRYVLEMLNSGASGYVTKSAAGRELLHALRAVARGEHYVSPELVGGLVDSVGQPRRGAAARSLGRREREVLQLIAEGHRSPEIAAQLFISVGTVEAHRRNIMRKLGLHTVAELTRFALREGLTSL
jgi:two-component system NarL family response regulator